MDGGVMASLDPRVPGLSPCARGPLEDHYELGEHLLIVANDRISVSGVVMPTPIPQKGRIQTQLSAFWFQKTSHIVPNHEVEGPIAAYVGDIPPAVAARSVLVRRTEPLPVDVAVCARLTGAAWQEYRESGRVGGVPQPPHMMEGGELPQPLVVPRTKSADGGRGGWMSHAALRELIGPRQAGELCEVSLELYRFGAAWAAARGVVASYARFEFGRADGGLLLVDKALTPDSAQLWGSETARDQGGPPPDFALQPLQDWLATIAWTPRSPPPELPRDVVRKTSARFREVFRRLTGPAKVLVP